MDFEDLMLFQVTEGGAKALPLAERVLADALSALNLGDTRRPCLQDRLARLSAHWSR